MQQKLLLTGFAFSVLVFIAIFNQAFAQFTDYNDYGPGVTSIPPWIKNTAGWWAADSISEIEFLRAIEFLIENQIINITVTQIEDISDITTIYTLPASRQSEFAQISGSFEKKHEGPLTLLIIHPNKTEQTITTISRDGTFTTTLELTSKSQIGTYLVYAEIEGEQFLVSAFKVKDRDATQVPEWIKNNADWWSHGLISDDDFIKGIEFLVENKILKV